MQIAIGLQCEALPRARLRPVSATLFLQFGDIHQTEITALYAAAGAEIKQKNRHPRALEVLSDFAYETNAQSFLIISFHERGLRIVIGYANGYGGNVTMLAAFLCRCRVYPLGHRCEPTCAQVYDGDATNAYGEATKVAPGACQPAVVRHTDVYLPVLMATRKFLNYRARASRSNERHADGYLPREGARQCKSLPAFHPSRAP